MFIAIYRWRLDPEREQDFVTHWQRITVDGIAAGSGGSSLFRGRQGIWVAIARWPSRLARDQFFAAQDDRNADPLASARAREAIIERLPDEELDSEVDLWAAFPDPAAPPGP